MPDDRPTSDVNDESTLGSELQQDARHSSASSTASQTPRSSSQAPSTLPPNSTPPTAVKATFDGTRPTSPARRNNLAAPPNTVQSARARSAALSPVRAQPASAGASTPSAAAVQRALSAANSSQSKVATGTDRQIRLAHAQLNTPKSPQPPSAGVKSPPPSVSSRPSSVTSNKQADSSTTSPSLHPGQRPLDVPERTLSPTQAQQRPPRGASGLGSRLETVEESSVSPQNRNKLPSSFPQNPSNQNASSEAASASADMGNRPVKPEKSDSKKEPVDRSTTPQPQPPSRKPSTSSLVPNKTRANAEGSRHMTVETETVPSIPQNATGAASDRSGSSRVSTGGSLRTKPSNDTIRPKKEKKKTSKRPPPIVSGPGSSKAELFEQRVASEIEGESTDSDETFVYESNPAEAQSRVRHHSRTPSTASLSGPPERHRNGLGGRVLTGGEFAIDRPIRPKRSMKFASSSYAGSTIDDEAGDTNQGTVRTSHNMRSTPRPDAHHKHVGRIHRDLGHGSDSPLDSDSPFSQARRMRTATATGWRSPRGERDSRSETPTHARTPTKKAFEGINLDANASATEDDERVPLLRGLRNPRTRGPHHLRHIDIYQSPERGSSWFGRMITFLGVASVFLLIGLLAGMFLFATSKPLYDVSVTEIQNVLASEEEIMLDLLVQAVNPNIATITVNDMDINVFAKSRYVSDPDHDDDGGKKNDTLLHTRRKWRRTSTHNAYGTGPSLHAPNAAGGVDDGTDPIPCPPWDPDCDAPGKDKDHDKQTMLLGRIFHFDSALSFEPAPLRRTVTNSSGELRLARPGNKTESGGSDRWERVLQHPFELIIRGILKYQLPLSTRVQTKSVGASVAVFPEDDVKGGSMRVMMLSRLESLERGEKKSSSSTLHMTVLKERSAFRRRVR